METRRTGALPVVDEENRVIGAVSEADLLRKAGYRDSGRHRGPRSRNPAGLLKARAVIAADLMTAPATTVHPVLARAARLMARRGDKAAAGRGRPRRAEGHRQQRRPGAGRRATAPSAVSGEDPGNQPETAASELLDRLVTEAAKEHPDVPLRTATVEGPARKVLVDRTAAADLVVLGARRRTGHFGLQLGRVAYFLPHHADCPVAVVPQKV